MGELGGIEGSRKLWGGGSQRSEAGIRESGRIGYMGGDWAGKQSL